MMKRYRLTLLFAATAVVAIAVAAVVVNLVVGNVAEDNLVKMAEDNTLREAIHVEALIRGRDALGGGTGAAPGESANVGSGSTSGPVTTLEEVVAYQNILDAIPSVAMGLNVVQISLLDHLGGVAWSTDSGAMGSIHASPGRVALAAGGEVSSKFTRDREVVDQAGQRRRLDVVETLLPLTDPDSGRVMGVVSIERDVSNDVSIQVDDTKSVVRWTTVGAMGGLFLVLLGYIVLADGSISRSRRRELSAVQAANRQLEQRVLQRTEELEEANIQLLAAQEQLVRTEKLATIGQLAGQVAHDIRNPLVLSQP